MKKKNVIMLGNILLGIVIGIFLPKKKKKEQNISYETQDKFRNYFSVLDKWMQLKEKKIRLDQVFLKEGYKRIAIYGVAHLGNHLIAELENSNVEIVYGIDRRAETLYSSIPLYGVDGEWEVVDAVIVTVTYDFENVKESIKDKINCPIISLEKIIMDAVNDIY